MKKEFKVGDRVKCINEVDNNKNVLYAEGTITEIRNDFFSLCFQYCVEFDKRVTKTTTNESAKGKAGHKWFCYAEDLELITNSKNNCIVIYQKENEVIALDKRTGKKAVAKGDPRDTFDFDIGAKLAFERLTNKVTFRVLCVKGETLKYNQGNVYEFIDGKTIWDDGEEFSTYESYEDFERNCWWRDDFIHLNDGDNPTEVLKRYNEIKVGDTVRVVDNGCTYTTYIGWLEKHIKDDTRYKWDWNKVPGNNSTGKVVKIAPWNLNSKEGKLLALVDIEGRYYIIGLNGLKKI